MRAVSMPAVAGRTIAGAYVLALAVAGAAHAATPCDPARALGVSRVVEIDTSGGPIYGAITKFAAEERFLAPKEVVLTFDDGPMPAVTRSVLATLDAFCTKATFFSVGRMAIAYPDLIKEELARGHTVGTHTWSHPLSLSRLTPQAAREEIERGFTAIAMAAGRPIAPFFRFPGLGDSQHLLTYLQSRKVATFTVDVVSNDSFISSSDRLIKTTLERVEQRQGGIVLFHDIKTQTAKALPVVLTELKARGYKVVHIRSKQGFEPDLAYAAALQPLLSKAPRRGEVFAGTSEADLASIEGDGDDATPVTALAPTPKTIALADPTSVPPPLRPASAAKSKARNRIAYGGGWMTTVRKSRPGSSPN